MSKKKKNTKKEVDATLAYYESLNLPQSKLFDKLLKEEAKKFLDITKHMI